MAGLTNHSMIKTARDAKVLARLGQAHAITTEIKTLKPKMMLLGLFAVGILFAAMQLQAAENWYEKNYKSQNSGDLKSMQATPDTKMYVSNHKEDDDISMLENGYDMMGSSGFTAGDVSAEQALQHAKTLKADTVLVYSKYGSAKTATSKIEMIKEAAKLGKELTEKDLEREPTNYKYYASYWAKLPAPLLGVHVIKLAKKESEDAEKATELDGLKVIAVIKDSPAAKAGIVRGDTLLKLAGNSLNKPEELSMVVRKHQGQEVAVEYERNGEKSMAMAQINARK
ncbi:MAG: PDZ domain-containing protein [Methylotenera sp.]|nr:PDZ domain-containing protein [Methylotenera sp.]